MVILVVNWSVLSATSNGVTDILGLINCKPRQYDILEGVRGRYAISQFGDCYL